MMPLFDYIQSMENHFLTLSAVHFYTNRQDFREAFRYLDLLRLQETPLKEVKKELAIVASALSAEDFAKDPEKDPSALALEYSSGFKWFSKFEFYYKYRWNELRKDKGTD